MMTVEKAYAIAADVLTEGICTRFMLGEVREASELLFLEGLTFQDARVENGACMILDSHIDRLTNRTAPKGN